MSALQKYTLAELWTTADSKNKFSSDLARSSDWHLFETVCTDVRRMLFSFIAKHKHGGNEVPADVSQIVGSTMSAAPHNYRYERRSSGSASWDVDNLWPLVECLWEPPAVASENVANESEGGRTARQLLKHNFYEHAYLGKLNLQFCSARTPHNYPPNGGHLATLLGTSTK